MTNDSASRDPRRERETDPREREDLEVLDRILAGEMLADTIPPGSVVAGIDAATLIAVRAFLANDDTAVVRDASSPSRTARADALMARIDPVPVFTCVSCVRTNISSRTRHPTRHAWLAGIVAAAVGILVVATFIHPSYPPAPSRVYTTRTGQRATVTLDDGSRVTLAPDSRLAVLPTAGATSRAMVLDGEAHFDARASASMPFLVRTGAVTTRVLGTTFDVRRYPSDVIARVAVLSGKVMFETARATKTVSAGQVGIATDSTTTVVAMPPATAAQYQDWTRGRIIFDDMPVAELLVTLRRWYGYDFRITDATLARQHVTGEFRADAFAETLAGLRGVLNVTLTFDGKTVTLYPRHAASPLPVRRDRPGVLSYSTEVGK